MHKFYLITAFLFSILFNQKLWAQPSVTLIGKASICANDSTTLMAQNTNTVSSFTWQLNGTDIPGANNILLNVKQIGNYRIRFNNSFSNEIAINTAATAVAPIITNIGNLQFCNGGSVQLNSSQLSDIQWQKDNINISPGGNAAGYLATVGGTYTVIYSPQGLCPAVSNGIMVTVLNVGTVSINKNAHAAVLCPSDSVVLNANTAQVKWQLNNQDITVIGVQRFVAKQNGAYRAIQPNANGSGCDAVSNEIIINQFTTNVTPPSINQTGTITICSGNTTTLTSNNNGIQWFVNNIAINNALGSSLLVSNSGVYSAKFINAPSCLLNNNSNAVTVNVLPIIKLPTISSIGNTTFCTGDSVTLVADTSIVQWQLNGVLISNTTSKNFIAKQSGTYTAIINNSNGCTSVSNSIVVSVLNAAQRPTITATKALTICSSDSISFISDIANVQWQLNGVDIANASFQSFIAKLPGTYRAYVKTSGSCGNIFSNTLTLNVITAPALPTITANGNTTFCTGGTVSLTSNIAGVNWYNDTALIATGNTSITVDKTGNYRAVNGTTGCISTSNIIPVIVTQRVAAPVITNTSNSNNFCSGNSILLSSNLSGVQWQKDGVNITGATSQTLNVTQTGVYRAYLTNSNACGIAYSSGLQITVTNAPQAPMISTNGGATTICSNQLATILSSDANSFWVRNDTTELTTATTSSIQVNQSGIYKAYTVNGGCKSFSNAITIVVNTLSTPTITATNNGMICNNNSITLSTTATNVQWILNGVFINGATNNSYTTNSLGNYTVQTTVTGCGSATSNVITVFNGANNTFTPTISAASSTNICNGSSVSISTNLTPVQWFKNGNIINGATAQTFSANEAGVYKASYVPANTCPTFSNEITVAIIAPSFTPTITANGNTTVCNGTGVTLNSNSANVTWQRDGTTVASNVNSIFANISGTYTAISTQGVCPSVSNSLVISISGNLATPFISAAGNTNFCNGGSVTLSSNINNVQWYKDGNAISGSVGASFVANSSGNYKAENKNGNCSIFSNEISVTVNGFNAPTISANGSTNVCNGGTVSLTASTSNVVWQKDGVNISSGVASIIATQTGVYTAVSTTGNCPETSNPISVTINPVLQSPSISATGSLNFCNGGNVTLVSNINNVQWIKDGNAIAVGNGFSYTASQSGTYKAGNIVNGCAAYSNEIIVTVTSTVAPTISANGNTNLCFGNSVTLTSNISNITWQKDGVNFLQGVSSIVANQSGIYTAFSNNNTCTATSNAITVVVNAAVIAPIISSAGATNICEGSNVTLVSNNASVQWLRNGNQTVGSGQTYMVTQPGTYTAIIFGSGNCTAISNAITITTITSPIVPVITAAGNTVICFGESVTLNSSIAGVSWMRDNNVISNGINNPSILASLPGAYKAVFNTGFCNISSNTITVFQTPQPLNPVVSVNSPNFCDTSGVLLASNINIGTMRWQLNGVDIPNSNNFQFLAKQSGTYRAIISVAGLCNSFSNNLPITVNLALKPVIVWDGNSFRTFTNYTSYQWFLNNVPIPLANSFTYKPTSVGSYRVNVNTIPTCTLSSDVFDLFVTNAINSSIISGTIKLYPNPASKNLHIDFPTVPNKRFSIRLINSLGKSVYNVVTKQQLNIVDVSSLSNGWYLAEIIEGREKQTFKVIVQH